MKRYLSWLPEVLIILSTLVVINNFLGNKEQVIKADGKGYYDYLPATFIYHDINFTYTDTLQTDYYNQKTESQGYLKTINGKQINKYFPGVSILWTPFFLGAHSYALVTDAVADGYSWPYQKAIFFAAIFYLFIGLHFLRKWLSLLNIPLLAIFILQGLLVFATPIIHYTQFDSAFTHVYSFSLITAFSYYILRFTRDEKPMHLVLSALIFGLVVIIRPVNILAFGMFFLCFSSLEELKTFLADFFKKQWRSFLLATLTFALVVSIVPLMWYVQTGNFIVWGYQDEGFNFLDPAFIEFLLSFRKGAFLHTPILFIAFFGGVTALIVKKEWYKLSVYITFFVIVVYVLSSWWSWWYGASFGSRPMIDYYVLFVFGAASFYTVLQSRLVKFIAGIAVLIFIPINLIQAFQYQNYIMDWGEMTYEKFETIGLNTEAKYRGIFFLPKVDYGEKDVVFTRKTNIIEPIHVSNNYTILVDSFNVDAAVDIPSITHIIIEADVEFQDGTTEIFLSVKDTASNEVYWHNPRVFGAVLDENTRTKAKLIYGVKNLPPFSTFRVGVSAQTDNIIVHGIEIKMISL